MKNNKPKLINETDHEITDEKGYVYHSLNYDPKLSSYHEETERYTLVKEGFNPIKIRKIFGQWEQLAYVSFHGDERWEKLTKFSEDVIQEHIRLYSVEN